MKLALIFNISTFFTSLSSFATSDEFQFTTDNLPNILEIELPSFPNNLKNYHDKFDAGVVFKFRKKFYEIGYGVNIQTISEQPITIESIVIRRNNLVNNAPVDLDIREFRYEEIPSDSNQFVRVIVSSFSQNYQVYVDNTGSKPKLTLISLLPGLTSLNPFQEWQARLQYMKLNSEIQFTQLSLLMKEKVEDMSPNTP